MDISAELYPESPQNIPASVTAISPSFKKEVSKVMISILLFFIVYIILILLATGLAAAAVYGGIALIIALPRFITIMLGIGLIGLGLMVLFFLIKFIFAVSRFDRTNSIEITKADHPALFDFIRKLTKETHTPFPKRIYLSPEVNACVFYNSGFWSMLLPVKKNLQIGLGLVNSVNLSEFKAVMAHEFGHFSQRSMKLGSFVYNVNRVIYNMLYENTSYSGALQNWANVSGYFAFFAGITASIVNAIQYILQKMYGFINKNYMGLSRQMEFHADAVAASVSGSNNCISALQRIELADSCYNVVINKCNEWFKQKYATGNLYMNQQTVFKHLAEEYKLPMQQHLPVVNKEFLKGTQLNRVNFKDQWASHPTLDEREKHLLQLQVTADIRQESAWVLFENPGKWQQQLTDKIYQHAKLTEDIKVLDKETFEDKYRQDVRIYSLPEVYKGFYDGREVTMLDAPALSTDAVNMPEQEDGFDTIFSAEHATIAKKIKAAETDIEVLKAIAGGKTSIKSFDFDGEKYKDHEASTFVKSMEEELKNLEAEQELADKKAYLFFYRLAQKQDSARAFRLKEGWTEYYIIKKKSQAYLSTVNDMLQVLQPLFSGVQLTVDVANSMIRNLKNNYEDKFKEYLRFWIKEGMLDADIDFKLKVTKYINSNHVYFDDKRFLSNEINELDTIARDVWELVSKHLFIQFKALLEMQLSLVNNQ